jgi:transposase-like protein
MSCPIKVSEVARSLGVSRWTVHNWIRRGIIPAELVTTIAGTTRVDAEKLDRLIKEGRLARPRRRAGSDAMLRRLLAKLAHEWAGKGECVHEG